MNPLRSLANVLPVTALIVAGCVSDGPTATEEGRQVGRLPYGALQVMLAPRDARDLDEILAAIADTVPGFGGSFADSAGNLHVYLKAGAETGAAIRVRSAAVEYARSSLPHLGAASAGAVNVLSGKYDWRELYRFKQAVSKVIVGLGDATIDIDETTNRVMLGLENERAVNAARLKIATLGLPEDAIEFRQQGRIFLDATLRDRMRPTIAGLAATIGNSVTQICTLGFSAMKYMPDGSLDPTLYAVVAAHCTQSGIGHVDGSSVHQFVPGSSNYVGFEVADPPWRSCGPDYPNAVCRYSDAALIAYVGESEAWHTWIHSTWPGSIEIKDGGFQVISQQIGSPGAGYPVAKVGGATGYTWGNVTESCVDVHSRDIIPVGPLGWLLCQFGANYWADQEDSGAPVFQIVAGGDPYWGPYVKLVGLHWGHSGTATTGKRYFSSFSNITREQPQELGPLITTWSY